MLRFALLVCILPLATLADSRVTVDGDLRCITSDGLPDHTTGVFPNRGNPHAMSEQHIHFCVDATPEYAGTTV